MEPEQNATPQKKFRLKAIIKRIITNRKFLISMALVVIIFVLEFTTDFVEIVIGSVMELTNPYRPRSGTIWKLYEKDRLASQQLEKITSELPKSIPEIAEIKNLSQLKDQLEKQHTVLITADQFRNLYNQIPIRISGDIISPFDLLKLSHNKKWNWTKVVKTDSNLSFFFLDGEKQLLMDSYPPLSVLYTTPPMSSSHQVCLDSMDVFKGRVFSAEQFFAIFDDLPNSIKLRLINNPYQLVKWDPDIQQVAISRYVEENSVAIGFQVRQGIYTEVYIFEASDWAVEYFIEQFNQKFPASSLDFPEDRYETLPDNY